MRVSHLCDLALPQVFHLFLSFFIVIFIDPGRLLADRLFIHHLFSHWLLFLQLFHQQPFIPPNFLSLYCYVSLLPYSPRSLQLNHLLCEEFHRVFLLF